MPSSKVTEFAGLRTTMAQSPGEDRLKTVPAGERTALRFPRKLSHRGPI